MPAWVMEATAMSGDRAVKVIVKLESEPNADQLAALRAEVEGSFRRQFGQWSAGPKSRTYEVNP